MKCRHCGREDVTLCVTKRGYAICFDHTACTQRRKELVPKVIVTPKPSKGISRERSLERL